MHGSGLSCVYNQDIGTVHYRIIVNFTYSYHRKYTKLNHRHISTKKAIIVTVIIMHISR